MSKEDLTLMKALFGEVAQTERSAIKHPTIEAERLGEVPPAMAMRAVAAHAARMEGALKALAATRAPTRGKVGTALGKLFSAGRNDVADFMLTTEQSYRGTLLGMRHGYDVVTLFRLAALAEGDAEVVSWCDPWLAERAALIRAVADQLQWFVAHPEHALVGAKRGARMVKAKAEAKSKTAVTSKAVAKPAVKARPKAAPSANAVTRRTAGR